MDTVRLRKKMTAKEYLKQYREAERRIKRLRTEYEQEVAMIDAIKSPMSGDGTPHGSGISKTVEIRAMNLIEKAEDLKLAELDAVQIRNDIARTIDKLSGEKADVLYERYINLQMKPYINLQSWDEVAKKVNYSVRHVARIHGEALNDLNMSLNVRFGP